MDPFWCITLGTIVIAKFWKREKRKNREEAARKRKFEESIEKEKRQAVVEKYTAIFSEPMTQEEIEAEKLAAEIKKRKEKDIAELRKQGFDEELITTIIPTINNGQ